MSWRLPSGKALAEFALQSGFLAPLLLGTPTVRRKKISQTNAPALSPGTPVRQELKEGPEAARTFRRGELRETR